MVGSWPLMLLGTTLVVEPAVVRDVVPNDAAGPDAPERPSDEEPVQDEGPPMDEEPADDEIRDPGEGEARPGGHDEAAPPVPPPAPEPPDAAGAPASGASPGSPGAPPSPVKGWVPAPRTHGPKAAPSEAALARQSDITVTRSKRSWRERWRRPGSPQRFAFEFKLGPYLPEIDSRYRDPGPGPYASIFGRTDKTGRVVKSPRVGVMPVVAFEWQFLYLAGPLALGTQIGLFRDTAKAPYAFPDPGGPRRSKADTVTFGMVPLSLLAIYRFELLADFYRVPLVPYAKAGLTYAFWWARDGSKKLAVNAAGRKGHGGVAGWQVNPGVALRLDFLEPGAAKKMDQGTGINHTYVFAEFQLTRLRNFGRGRSIDLGDKTFFAGLAMEF